MIAPVILWNARHGWASFEFQGARGVPENELHPARVFTMAIGEIAFLSPWIFACILAALAHAFRHGWDERRMFLICLSLPAIIVFTVIPLWGASRLSSLGDARLVFYVRADGRVAQRTRYFHDGALRGWALLSSAALAALVASRSCNPQRFGRSVLDGRARSSRSNVGSG